MAVTKALIDINIPKHIGLTVTFRMCGAENGGHRNEKLMFVDSSVFIKFALKSGSKYRLKQAAFIFN